MKDLNPKEFKVVVLRDCPVPEEMQLQESRSSIQTELQPLFRTLKIEADGDFWKGPRKPKIRLMGRWLERAGFTPGNRVNVTCVAPGVIELRSPDTMIMNKTKRVVIEQPEFSF